MEEPCGIRRRTWAEVDLDAVRQNYLAVRQTLSKETKLCCVIKADAYGHGAMALGRFYEKIGADFFAVSNIEEALQLRAHRITRPILILGYTPEECASLLAAHDISQCVYSLEYGGRLARYAEQAHLQVKIHIKLDTGMGRIGFLCRDESESELGDALAVCRMESLIPEGIFTHCSVADGGAEGDGFTRQQFDCFMKGVAYLERNGVTFAIRHFANSATIFDHPDYHLDMVRAGIVLYGLPPSQMMRNLPSMIPAMSLRSVISHCKQLRKGESISYGRTFVAQQEMTVATVPIGYADGYLRQNQYTNGYLTLKDRQAPIIGRVCMDQLMVDVTDIPCKAGDVVTVFGQGGREAEELARENRTIGYEILCSVGTRVPRIYIENGKTVEIMDYLCSEEQ